MEITCEYCHVQFCQITRAKKMRFCSRRCQQNSAYHSRNKSYYKNRYEAKKETILEVNRQYRSQERVKQLRKGYAESYKDLDRERSRQRRAKDSERQANQGRHKAKKILEKVAIKQCCHCKTKMKVQCHHIDEDPTNNTITNLCWLCRAHHELLHALILPEVRAQIRRSIQDFQRALPTS